VREALLADSVGSLYVDSLDIQTAGGIVRVEGVVEDLDLQDHLLGVVESVPGVTEVRDALRLPDDEPAGLATDERAEP
jgi:osmotically-inducible protein OsmY